MLPEHCNNIFDFEQTLDYLCDSRWYYVGGYAALRWMYRLNTNLAPTDDLDVCIPIGHYQNVVDHFTRLNVESIDGYRIQFLSIGSIQGTICRLGSCNVLDLKTIVTNYEMLLQLNPDGPKAEKRRKRITLLKPFAK